MTNPTKLLIILYIIYAICLIVAILAFYLIYVVTFDEIARLDAYARR